jgi:hypothetical protein
VKLNTTIRRPLRSRLVGGAALTGTLLFAACASTPPEPTLAMHAAEQAIAVADTSRVADTSSPELAEARTKLDSAKVALSHRQMTEADQLAKESRADAELASARFAQAKARAVNDEIEHSTQTLAQEMQRNAGAR